MLGRLNKVVTRSLKPRLPSRHMGGHGGKPPGPYDAPHHAAYPEEAYAFGMKPGDPLEGWEYTTFAVFFISFFGTTFGMMMKDKPLFQDWARREAMAREKLIENGGEVEFGKYYQTVKYKEEEGIDQIPKVDEE